MEKRSGISKRAYLLPAIQSCPRCGSLPEFMWVDIPPFRRSIMIKCPKCGRKESVSMDAYLGERPTTACYVAIWRWNLSRLSKGTLNDGKKQED